MSSNRVINGMAGAMFNLLGVGSVGTPVQIASRDENPQAHYAALRSLARNVNVYKDLATVLSDYGLSQTAMQGLRNPTNAVCALYEAQIWAGTIREDDEQSALPLELPVRGSPTQIEQRRAGIHQVWRWSNLNDRKDPAAYDAAMLGDQLIKVVNDRDRKRAWFEFILPDYLTDLDVDGRGYLTYVRLDVPRVRRNADGTTETFIHTEVWDKAAMRYRRWERRDLGTGSLDQLGTPAEDLDMEQVFGVDFVPFVHWKFDVESDSLRGVAAVSRALDKILYGDALVTALHRRLSREVDWVLEGVGTDPDGMPIPAPDITSNNGGEITFGDGTLKALPAGWRLRDLIAGLDYAAHLAAVQDHYKALRETDLPELAWGSISESGGDLSGKAINYKLTAAKSKIEKARGRAESALIRATQMCLSVAQQLDAPGFKESEIGTYAKGDLDFWIADREIVPLSESERSEIETQRVARVQGLTTAGLEVDEALRLQGYSDDQIEQATAIVTGIER